MRYIENQQNAKVRCFVAFIESMVDNEIINENIIQPIVQNTMLKDSGDILGSLQNQIIISNHVEKTTDVDKLLTAIINGDTVLIMDGSPAGLMICSKGWRSRSIAEPQG
jgi:spore germination protein KA